MLEQLKFVRGSISKKDLVPELTHFVIKDGRVSGFNGTLALSSPIPFNITCNPKAEPLIKAISNCTDTVQLSLTATGRLTVKSGSFKVHLDCIENQCGYLLTEPEGEIIKFNSEAFYEGVKLVAPFVGQDASRRWAQGILIRGKSLFATNNVVLVKCLIGTTFPNEVNIPLPAVKEMLRIKEAPLYAQVAENSVTFHYTQERWLRTQLYSTTEWPDFSGILNRSATPVDLDQRLFEGLETVRPFISKSGAIFLEGNKLTTHDEDNEGASYEVPELDTQPVCFHIDHLALLKDVAVKIDFSLYPAPCLFHNGGNFCGAIAGMRAK